jgi:hypothetical protein
VVVRAKALLVHGAHFVFLDSRSRELTIATGSYLSE